MRLTACFGIPLDIVMPCGFPLAAADLRRAAMDYAAPDDVVRHASFANFTDGVTGQGARIVLLTTAGDLTLPNARFRADDILLFGSEAAGVPVPVHDRADLRVRIPMRPGYRSLNIAVAAGIALAEAMRQTGLYPND